MGRIQEYFKKASFPLIYVINSMGWERSETVEIFIDYEILPLGKEFQIGCDENTVSASDDNLDAVLCLLAASDFLNDKSYKPSPEMMSTVEKESWIWVRKKSS